MPKRVTAMSLLILDITDKQKRNLLKNNVSYLICRKALTTEISSICGYINNATKDLSVREWDCPQCGTHHDRDVNAAINIKDEGMRMLPA